MIYDIWYMINKENYIWCILKKLLCTSHEWVVIPSKVRLRLLDAHRDTKCLGDHRRSCRSNGGISPFQMAVSCLINGGYSPLASPGMILQVGGGFKHFYVHPYTGEIWSDLTKIFQVGWNHQLEKQPKGENIGVAPWYIVTDLDFQHRWTDPRRSCKNSHPVHPIDWGHCQVFGTQARTNSGLAFLGSLKFQLPQYSFRGWGYAFWSWTHWISMHRVFKYGNVDIQYIWKAEP